MAWQEHFRMMGTVWDLITDGSYDDRLAEDDAVAKTYLDTRTVALSTRADPGPTMLHELIHVVENTFGLEFDEQEVEILSRGLYAIGRDNPNLMKEVYK